MDFREQYLYEQIHPLKRCTDISTAVVALYRLWQHDLVLTLLVMFILSIVVSLVSVKHVNLERDKRSALGQSMKQRMTRTMAMGAWSHLYWLIPIGLSITRLGWLRGVLFLHQA